jgi:hypothetical protein
VQLQGELLLRVRQLGYAYLDLTLSGRPPERGGGRWSCAHASPPPSVSTTAARIAADRDDVRPLALWAGQLREGAER